VHVTAVMDDTHSVASTSSNNSFPHEFNIGNIHDNLPTKTHAERQAQYYKRKRDQLTDTEKANKAGYCIIGKREMQGRAL
jgi:hypothetical protein